MRDLGIVDFGIPGGPGTNSPRIPRDNCILFSHNLSPNGFSQSLEDCCPNRLLYWGCKWWLSNSIIPPTFSSWHSSVKESCSIFVLSFLSVFLISLSTPKFGSCFRVFSSITVILVGIQIVQFRGAPSSASVAFFTFPHGSERFLAFCQQDTSIHLCLPRAWGEISHFSRESGSCSWAVTLRKPMCALIPRMEHCFSTYRRLVISRQKRLDQVYSCWGVTMSRSIGFLFVWKTWAGLHLEEVDRERLKIQKRKAVMYRKDGKEHLLLSECFTYGHYTSGNNETASDSSHGTWQDTRQLSYKVLDWLITKSLGKVK